jgi:hypothetical protein
MFNKHTAINAELNNLRDLSAHRIFCAILEICAIYLHGIRRHEIGTLAIITTVALITLHGIGTYKN